MTRTKRLASTALATMAVVLLPFLAGCGSDDTNNFPVTARQLGALSSVLSGRITGRVTAPSADAIAPVLLQGETLATLRDEDANMIRMAYAAGETIVLLDADMEHIAALHDLVGEGLAYSSATDPTVMAYTLRREGGVPTSTNLTNPRLSPLGLEIDDSRALDRAADFVVDELRHVPRLPSEAAPTDDGPVAWQEAPLQTTTLAQNGYWGIYNTLVNVYALHACVDNTDRYVVTAEADWTPTRARFQTAQVYDHPAWEDGTKWCRATIFPVNEARQCRYIDYPLFYRLDMEAPTTGTVRQINAAPAGTQGTTTSYMSGFTFSIGGTVNVSASGPSGGIRVGASWTNAVTSTVPPLKIDAGNIDNTENAFWKYEYCTAGEEESGSCTNHVQTDGVSGLCKAFKMGQPQNGQTPNGKFSNVVTSVYWQAESDTRIGSTYDIKVTFDADMGTTSSDLFTPFESGTAGDCNVFNCSCTTSTSATPEISSVTFKVPFPSTKCAK